MADTRFRPTIYPLEARDVPASGVTPQQVFIAINFVNEAQPIIQYLSDNFDLARAGGAGQSLLTSADLSNGAADTLSKFRSDAQEAAAANPANSETLLSLIAGSTTLITQAQANAATAEALAARLGVNRPPPPPPPITGVGDGKITPQPDQNPPGSGGVGTTTPADGSLLATTIPDTTTGFTSVGTQGLTIKDNRVGTGDTATSSSKVNVRYRGFLASNGTEFDSNVGTDKDPLSATLGPTATQRTVIQGFGEGVVGMKVGGTRTIFIPSAIGYGASGSGTSIPANADLVFEVQLLGITG